MHVGAAASVELRPLRRGEPQRKGVGQRGNGGARLGRGLVRRTMVADDQPPKQAVAEHGHRHGAVDAHVAVILQVHRRQAAQPGEGQVDRPVVPPSRRCQEGHGHVVAVGHPSHRAARVEFAGLPRDVRGGEAQAKEGLVPPRDLVLRDRHPVPIAVEAVDEHALVAGNAPDRVHGDVGEVVHRAGRHAEPPDRALQQPCDGARGGGALVGSALVGGGFQLQDDEAVVGVDHGVEGRAPAINRDRGFPGQVGG